MRPLGGALSRALPTKSILKHARANARRGKAGVRHDLVSQKKLPPAGVSSRALL
jgi:hypothetical protein